MESGWWLVFAWGLLVAAGGALSRATRWRGSGPQLLAMLVVAGLIAVIVGYVLASAADKP